MELIIKQKPFGYLKVTPYLIFIDGELVGKVNRFSPLKINVEKEEFELTIKDNFYQSTRRCSVRFTDTILFDTIDNFPMCVHLLYCLLIIILALLHINMFLPNTVLIAWIFIFPAFVFLYNIINRKNYFLIENVEKPFAFANDKLVVDLPNKTKQLIDIKYVSYFLCDNSEVVAIMKNGERIQQVGTLLELENWIPQEYWIRANRQTLVMRDSIVSYNSSALCVRVNGQDMIIRYFSTKSNEVFDMLKRWNPNIYIDGDYTAMRIGDGNESLSDDLKRLWDYLEQNPNANMQQVAENLHISIRTAQRRLSELRKLNQI